jgi:cytochrome c oxidase subunit 2
VRSLHKTLLSAAFGLGLSTVWGLSAMAAPADHDQSFLNPASPEAQHISDLWYIVLVPAMLVLVFVGGAIIYAAFRFRDPGAPPEGTSRVGWANKTLPRQMGGNNALEFTWTLIPALILFGIFGLSLSQVTYLRHTPQPDALHVQVMAQQFAWQFTYPGKVTSFNTLYIPAGTVVNLDLESKDVIHSWTVPRLSGHLDAIPGQHNKTFIQAPEPGNYYGQCTELCGVGHAGMRITVTVLSQADFDKWYLKQKGSK